jgi:hypothetical protein
MGIGLRSLSVVTAFLRLFDGNGHFRNALREQARLPIDCITAYTDLLSFVGDEDRDVALHAIAGFGSDAPTNVIDDLISDLVSEDQHRAPAASEALRNIGGDAVLNALITTARQKKGADGWILATLGRLPSDKVRAALRGDPLLDRLSPLLLLSNSSNWLADDTVDIDLKFLLKQNL